MASRHEDWLNQERDLAHARHDLTEEYYEWAAFSAQQAAEKAIKGVYQRLGAEVRGHSIVALLRRLPKQISVSKALLDRGRSLDLHYISPRYPNSVPEGTPGDSYTRREAEEAIEDAGAVLAFCESHIFSKG
jgi:HEPN domain-containing protein